MGVLSLIKYSITYMLHSCILFLEVNNKNGAYLDKVWPDIIRLRQ